MLRWANWMVLSFQFFVWFEIFNSLLPIENCSEFLSLIFRNESSAASKSIPSHVHMLAIGRIIFHVFQYLFDVGIRQIILPLILKSGNKSLFKYYMSNRGGRCVFSSWFRSWFARPFVAKDFFLLLFFASRSSPRTGFGIKFTFAFAFSVFLSSFKTVRTCTRIDNTTEQHIRIGRRASWCTDNKTKIYKRRQMIYDALHFLRELKVSLFLHIWIYCKIFSKHSKKNASKSYRFTK